MPAGAPLWRDPDLARVLGANLLSSTGVGISIIAVPWMIVSGPGGPGLLGVTTVVTTLVLLLVMPVVGGLVDRFPRRLLLLGGEGLGLLAMAGLALGGRLGAAPGEAFATWALVGAYFTGMLYYTLHYPVRFALNQELVARERYGELNGLTEVQGQTASMACGGLATLLVGRVPLEGILAANALCHLAAGWLILGIRHRAAPRAPEGRRPGVAESLREAAAWLGGHRRAAWFLGATMIPFLGVMAANFLFPIYVAKTLEAGPTLYGAGEVAFAVGALLAGLLVPGLQRSRGPWVALAGGFGVYLAGTAILAGWAAAAPFLVANFLFGLGNAGVRVARNTLAMLLVPNHVMGRIGLFFNLAERVGRTLLVLLFTAGVGAFGAQAGFAVVVVMAAAAFLVVRAHRPET